MRPLLAAVVFCLAPIVALAQTETIQPTKAEKTIETRTLALKSGSTLKVKNVNGAVTVEGWDREEVEFRGEFKPSSRDEHVKVEIERSANGLEIVGRMPKNAEGSSYRGPECRMELKVPRQLLATVSTVNGAVSLKGTRGEASVESVNGAVTISSHSEGLKASTVNGAIHVDSVQGGLKLKTVNGAIEARGLDTQGKGIQASTVNGQVHLQTAGLKGRLEASTVNGNLSLKAKGAEQVEVGKRRLSAVFQGGGEAITLSTVNGSITVE
jgi:DUF4097 and DUF4098 domain-containing protein YvlB